MEQQVPQQESQQPFNQQPIPQPPVNQQGLTPQENPGRIWSVIGLITGILGVVLACSVVFFFLSFILAIAALVCGIIGRNRTPEGIESGMAIASIVLGIVGLVIGVIMVAFWMLAFAGIAAEIGTTDIGEVFQYLLTY